MRSPLKPIVAVLVCVVALTAPAGAAAQATLEVDPVEPCYRERSRVFLPGSGFSPGGPVVFTRDARQIGDPIQADGSGQVLARLRLPGLLTGQRQLTYVATDTSNPALTAQVSMLVTATDVGLQPANGDAHRLLTIRARGFFGRSGTVYAHIVRAGRRAGKPRNMRIGRVRGACRTLTARRRLFSRDARPGRYRVQFDTFRRYRKRRAVKTTFNVTVFPTSGAARVPALSRASWR